jgi:hypothetical protein
MHGIFSPTQLLPQEHSSPFPAKIKHIIVVSWNDEIPFSSQGGTHTMHLLCFTKAFNTSIAAADDAPPRDSTPIAYEDLSRSSPVVAAECLSAALKFTA